ncbi:NUDIX domain-containing protein [Candidatus Kuenenbacteria bacterium]|nr:NUDIX domain-containing protein [Candidatus Kuenenbacteria bacterium]
MKRDVSLILLFDKEKRILLQHRSSDAKSLPDFWAFFGGGIEKGETPEQALARESKEELDYTPQNPNLIMTQEFKYENVKSKKYVYMEEYNDSIKLTQGEGQAMDWFDIEDMGKLKMVDHDREVIAFIRDKY